jgi:hypothetical protein
MLSTASDWHQQADLRDRMQFPPEITVTIPDFVIWSLSSRQASMVELLPRHGTRKYKLRGLRAEQGEVQESGCRLSTVWAEVVVPSCRGGMPRIRGQSMWRALRVIDVIGADRRQFIGRLGREAEMAFIYLPIVKLFLTH